MSLYEKFESDMRSALKEGAANKLSVMRLLVAAIRQEQIDKRIDLSNDAVVLQILQRQIKQRKDSIEQFKNGNRQDLADKEIIELKVLEAYMPEQMGEEELSTLVRASIAEIGAKTKSDTGKVMKLVMEKAKGRCDGKLVNQLVMKLLQ